MSNKLKVLVIGATGQQGGAVAKRLLDRGHTVRGLVRHTDTEAAAKLKERGAEIMAGDMLDRPSLDRAAHGMDAIFSVSTFFETGLPAETQQGMNVAEAAKATGVKHLVYSTVASADQNTGIPHFDSKRRIEEHILKLNIPHTIVAPVYFMENLFSAWNPGIQNAQVVFPMPSNCALQQVTLEDLGNFNLLVLENRDRFLGKRIDLASDSVTGLEMARIISKISGRRIEFRSSSIEDVRAWSADYAIMYEWFIQVGYRADIQGLRRDFPEVGWHSFNEWAKKQDWSDLKEVPVEA